MAVVELTVLVVAVSGVVCSFDSHPSTRMRRTAGKRSLRFITLLFVAVGRSVRNRAGVREMDVFPSESEKRIREWGAR